MGNPLLSPLAGPLATPFMPMYRSQISSLGFEPPVDVSRMYGIGALIPNRNRRSGIYLLVLDDGLFYIGRAKDVVRRFAAHRKNFGERLVGFSYQIVPGAKQPEVERSLIHHGEKSLLPLRQTEWTSQRRDESDLDALFTPEEYADWARDPIGHLAADDWPLAVGKVGQEAVGREKFERLTTYVMATAVIDLVGCYVQHCVPFARRTAPGYWNVACLPSTNRSTAPRFACVSAHVMETLVVGHDHGDPESMWSFVVAAKTPLEAKYGSLAKSQRAIRGISIEDGERYKSAGFDQCQIFMDDLEAARRVMALPVVQQSARLLMHRVMQKGVNRYARYHCGALAEAILLPWRDRHAPNPAR